MNASNRLLLIAAVFASAFARVLAGEFSLPDGRYRIVLFQEGADHLSGGVKVIVERGGKAISIKNGETNSSEKSLVQDSGEGFTFSVVQSALGSAGSVKNTYAGFVTKPGIPQLVKGYYSSEAPGFTAKGIFIMIPEKD